MPEIPKDGGGEEKEEKAKGKRMRVANKNIDFVTQEQIDKARSVDLLDYVKRTERDNLERCGQDEYRLKDHDSLVISNGKFNWFSRGIGGSNAIDFLVKVRGIEFRDAVRELESGVFSPSYSAPSHSTPAKPKPKDTGHFFMLPEANGHNNDVIEYLKGRGIEENIILDCINKGMVYQSKKGNCIFVGFDEQQAPKFACERCIGISELKKDVAGSNKAFNFCLPPKNNDANRVYVFEGVTDCLSHASIAQIGNTDWDGYRLSLGGVSFKALESFLERNPHITQVYLGFDNDTPGKTATERIIKEVLEKDSYNHVSLFVAPPPVGNDYNDTLKVMQAQIKEHKLQAEKSTALETPKPAVGKRRSDAVL